MSEAKYTPGPWLVDPLAQGILGDVSTIGGGQCVAQAQQIAGDDRKQNMRLANAKLISAAPDLLKALKVVLESWRETNDAGPLHSGYQSDWMIEQIRLADEAIEKAEGRDPKSTP